MKVEGLAEWAQPRTDEWYARAEVAWAARDAELLKPPTLLVHACCGWIFQHDPDCLGPGSRLMDWCACGHGRKRHGDSGCSRCPCAAYKAP